MKKYLITSLLVAVFLIGTALRFYQLGAIPGSLEWDEVSYGYNAYSILQTGKDEYGVSHPISLRAFGEYKQPVYAYLDVISIKLFGLTPFAIRFPSALFGSLTILFVYFLVLELFFKSDRRKVIALLSAFFFAISPWSIQFSRAAFEANVALFFIISGVFLILYGIRKNNISLLFIAAILLSLSMYTYLSSKIFVPILIIALFFKHITYFKKKKLLVIALLLFMLLCNSLWILDRNNTTRGSSVLFTNQQNQIVSSTLQELTYDKQHNDLFGEIIHNRRIAYGEILISNYFSHFNPIWLFISGDSVARHHPPGMGNLYLVALPFILIGIFVLIRQFPFLWFILIWFLFAPIASTITDEAPHSLRSLIFLPTWQIFEALGVVYSYQYFRKNDLFKKSFIIFVTVLFSLNFIYYLHQYFVHTNTDSQKDWQYGYAQAVEFAENTPSDKNVFFSSGIEQAYIYYLFYSHYDPTLYLSQGGSSRIREKCFSIANAYFGSCDDKIMSGDYIVTTNDNFSKATKIQSYDYTNGKPAVFIYKSM